MDWTSAGSRTAPGPLAMALRRASWRGRRDFGRAVDIFTVSDLRRRSIDQRLLDGVDDGFGWVKSENLGFVLDGCIGLRCAQGGNVLR